MGAKSELPAGRILRTLSLSCYHEERAAPGHRKRATIPLRPRRKDGSAMSQSLLAMESDRCRTPRPDCLVRSFLPSPDRQIHPENKRYFTDGTKTPDGSVRAIYLTGSHTWGNLCVYPPERYPPFDYPAYLDFLDRYHHTGPERMPQKTPTRFPVAETSIQPKSGISAWRVPPLPS